MHNLLLSIIVFFGATTAFARSHPGEKRIEAEDTGFERLVAPDAAIETLASGIVWAEGPLWFEDGILFSDVPRNIVYRWKPGMLSHEVFLKPSGQITRRLGFREPGSNGLALDPQGRLLLCQQGERRIARWANGQFAVVADRFEGKQFNSPNDLVVRRDGEVYFTDPPYGLEDIDASPLRELPWHGVYRVATEGKVTLLTKTIKFPNGIAFSPDEKTLYVSSSEPGNSRIVAFDVTTDGVTNERVFFDARPLSDPDAPGACDGMKVDRDGNLWASGPGGILVIDPHGKLLGRIRTGVPTANCAWGDDGGTLYITANHFLLRVRTKTKGAGW